MYKNYKVTYEKGPKDEHDYTYISKLTYDSYINENGVSPISPVSKMVIMAPSISQPSLFSLETSLSPILDQGVLNSCVSNAFSLCISTMTNNKVNLSRLFCYLIARINQNKLLSTDSGTTIPISCSVIKNYGVCNEYIYPYNNIPFAHKTYDNSFKTMPLNAFNNSYFLTNFKYFSVNQDLDSLKSCLIDKKVPIIFAFYLYSSFYAKNVTDTGVVPMPDVYRENKIGGHCMLIIGYDNIKKSFICANSWGTNWGNKGICYMPYDYLVNPNLAFDFYYLSFTL